MAAVTAAAVAVAVTHSGDGHSPTDSAPPPDFPRPVTPTVAAVRCPAAHQSMKSPAAWRHAVALALPGRGSALERRDPHPDRVPWTLIVRDRKGGLGTNEDLVTFPVARPHGGHRIQIGNHPGRRRLDQVTWAVGSGYVTARGDLFDVNPAALAGGIHIRHGRPTLPSASPYRTATVPARPTVVREVRYDARRLGDAGRALGGLVFTGVARTAQVDDWMLSTATPARHVGGHTAVVTSLFGGNGELVWELQPGMVAYVGYSGAGLDDRSVHALQCLATHARPLSAAQWRRLRPPVVDSS